MLSRIADSLFWMARYMDRAENAARLLDVTYHMLLEQAPQTYRLRWDAVLRMTGDQALFYKTFDEAGPERVCEFLLFREDHSNSIVSCVTRVREIARTIRDRISREMWENVNGLYHRVRQMQSAELPNQLHTFCREVIGASHAFNGITDGTLPHDDGWHFLQAGRAIERAENTSRVVDVEYHKLLETSSPVSHTSNHQWMAVLRSVAAYEMYRRTYHAGIEPLKVAELLILHARHPRSVRFNIAWLQTSLRAVSGTGPHSYANEAERLTGKLHDSLVYDRIQDIFARGLHLFLNDLEHTCRKIGEQIARSYFYYSGVA